MMGEAIHGKVNLKVIKSGNLRRIRETLGKTQGEIGAVIAASTSYISDVERGVRTITDRVIEILAEEFGLDPCEFFKTTESKFVVNDAEVEFLALFRRAQDLGVASEGVMFLKYLINNALNLKTEKDWGKNDTTDTGEEVPGNGGASHSFSNEGQDR